MYRVMTTLLSYKHVMSFCTRCYVMSWHVMSCYVLLCYVLMLCYVMILHVKSFCMLCPFYMLCPFVLMSLWPIGHFMLWFIKSAFCWFASTNTQTFFRQKSKRIPFSGLAYQLVLGISKAQNCENSGFKPFFRWRSEKLQCWGVLSKF